MRLASSLLVRIQTKATNSERPCAEPGFRKRVAMHYRQIYPYAYCNQRPAGGTLNAVGRLPIRTTNQVSDGASWGPSDTPPEPP